MLLGMAIKVAKTEQACAFGAAMFAAVAAGGNSKRLKRLRKQWDKSFAFTYQPNMENHALYNNLYKNYQQLGKFTEENTFPA